MREQGGAQHVPPWKIGWDAGTNRADNFSPEPLWPDCPKRCVLDTAGEKRNADKGV